MLIAALIHKSHGMASRRRNAQAGFSMALVLLVMLTVILGSAAIVSRTSSGLLGASLQSRNREARDVAESGIVQIISELNKEPNRRLLVAGTAPGSWVAANLVNPCTGWDSNGNVVSTQQPSATAIGYGDGTSKQLVSGNATRVFSLVSLTYSDINRNAFTVTPVAQTVGTDKSLLKITVLGQVKDAAGNVISEARVTREFEVAPKCCERSFGNNINGGTTFGTDKRTCYSIPGAGLGIILGFNGGTASGSSATIPVVDENGNTVTTALCIKNKGNTNCDAGSLKLGKNISVIPKVVPLTLPTYPFTNPPDSPAVTTRVALDAKTKKYIGIKTGAVRQCNISGTTLSNCVALSNCGTKTGLITDPFPLKQYFCRLTSIDVKNVNLVVDTSNEVAGTRIPLNLFFDDPASTADYITLGGNGTIEHRYCATPPAATAACTTVAGVKAVNGGENLNLFANGSGTFTLQGTSGAAINIYAPKASVTMNGTGNGQKFAGRSWSNNLTIIGQPPIATNNGVPAGNWFTPPADLIGSNPNVDWIARSVSYSSSY